MNQPEDPRDVNLAMLVGTLVACALIAAAICLGGRPVLL